MRQRSVSRFIKTALPKQGFRPASAWNVNTSYLQKATHFQEFKKVEPKNVKNFQLWNQNAHKWSDRITNVPKILNERDILKWQQFKTQSLQLNQLYLWRTSQNEWIPLWSMDTGFLML